MADLQQIKAIAPPGKDYFRKLSRYPLQSEIPESLHPVEWSNLHQVLEGSFSKAGQKELLFISGRKEGYFFALYSMAPLPFQLLWSDQLQRELPPGYGPELMFNFQQVLAHDFDQDGSQEVLIHGEYKGMTTLVDGLVFLRLSHPKTEQKIQLLPIQAIRTNPIPKEGYIAFPLPRSSGLLSENRGKFLLCLIKKKRVYCLVRLKSTPFLPLKANSSDTRIFIIRVKTFTEPGS